MPILTGVLSHTLVRSITLDRAQLDVTVGPIDATIVGQCWSGPAGTGSRVLVEEDQLVWIVGNGTIALVIDDGAIGTIRALAGGTTTVRASLGNGSVLSPAIPLVATSGLLLVPFGLETPAELGIPHARIIAPVTAIPGFELTAQQGSPLLVRTGNLILSPTGQEVGSQQGTPVVTGAAPVGGTIEPFGMTPAYQMDYAALLPPNNTNVSGPSALQYGVGLGTYLRLGLTQAEGGTKNARIVSDPTAPTSPPHALAVSWIPGMVINGNDQASPIQNFTWGAARYDELYERFYIKLPDPDWECSISGQKIFGYWYWGTAGAPGLVVGKMMNPQYQTQTVKSAFDVQFEMNVPGGGALLYNLSIPLALVCEMWQKWEIYIKLNTIGNADGIFRVALNGQLVVDAVLSTWRNATVGPIGFFERHWDAVYGGGSGVPKVRADDMYIDSVYGSLR